MTHQPFDLTRLVVSEEQSAERSPGVHVSDIVRRIALALGKKESGFTEEQLDRFALLGRLWEKQLSETLFLPPRYRRIGEIEKDGIIGSPDCLDTIESVVQEFKVTWVSSRNFEGGLRWTEYVYQVKSYCCLTEFLRARLIVLFVCGDWRPPVPHADQWSFVFTSQELAEHWRIMRNNMPKLGGTECHHPRR